MDWIKISLLAGIAIVGWMLMVEWQKFEVPAMQQAAKGEIEEKEVALEAVKGPGELEEGSYLPEGGSTRFPDSSAIRSSGAKPRARAAALGCGRRRARRRTA